MNELDELYDGDEDFGEKSPLVPRRLKEKPAPKNRKNRLPAYDKANERRIPSRLLVDYYLSQEELDDQEDEEVEEDDNE